jgi:hypothetical protein
MSVAVTAALRPANGTGGDSLPIPKADAALSGLDGAGLEEMMHHEDPLPHFYTIPDR